LQSFHFHTVCGVSLGQIARGNKAHM
jgi:hypothetical protein